MERDGNANDLERERHSRIIPFAAKELGENFPGFLKDNAETPGELAADNSEEAEGQEESGLSESEESAFLSVFGELLDQEADDDADDDADTGYADEESADVFAGSSAESAFGFDDDIEEDSTDENKANRKDGDAQAKSAGRIANGKTSAVATETVTNEGDAADSVPLTPETLLEAMLFVGDRDNRPLSASRAAELMRNVEPGEIPELVAHLNARYIRFSRPYRIVEDGDGYRMVLDSAFDSIRARFYGKIREAKLSQQAIDVLAVVAYRQPVSAEEVQAVRKTPSGSVLNQLVRRGLLGIERKTEAKKPVLFYRTTPRFLELFGLDSLDDLPMPEEIEFR